MATLDSWLDEYVSKFPPEGRGHQDIRHIRCPLPDLHGGGRDKKPSGWVHTPSGKWGCFSCGSNGGLDELGVALAKHLARDPDGLYVADRSRGPAPPQKPLNIQQPRKRADLNGAHLRRRASAVHFYRDEEGEAVLCAVRWKEGGVAYAHADPDGWFWGMGKVKPQLYGSHLLAKRPNETVVLVEGEKCADALNRYMDQFRKRGWTAVTAVASIGGAANWQKARGLDVLTKRRVIVWPDLDRVGMEYADGMAGRLKDIASRLYRVDVEKLADDHGIEKKGWDVADAIEDQIPPAELIRTYARRVPLGISR